MKDNKRLKSEISTHKAQLEALRARDPEFYAYLQQTDAGLLDFQDDEDDEEGDDDDEDEDDGKNLVGLNYYRVHASLLFCLSGHEAMMPGC